MMKWFLRGAGIVLACIYAYDGLTAADLPVKAPRVVPVATNSYGFYIGIDAGAGFSNQKSDITLPGVSTGTPSIWPVGGLLGLTMGYGLPVGSVYLGLEADFDYDFTHASVGCMPGAGCLSTSKNSWFFAQKVVLGLPPAQWAIPSWPWTSGFMPAAVVGAAERNVDMCVPSVTSANNICGSQWMGGLLVGGQARLNLAPGWFAKIEYDYVRFDKSFTPQSSLPIFVGFTNKDMQVVKAGVYVNF